MNALASNNAQTKRPAEQPAFQFTNAAMLDR
jgi:hypothetical protein